MQLARGGEGVTMQNADTQCFIFDLAKGFASFCFQFSVSGYVVYSHLYSLQPEDSFLPPATSILLVLLPLSAEHFLFFTGSEMLERK